MYVDKELLFSDSQDLSQTQADYSSSNIIHVHSGDLGLGTPMAVVITVDEAFDSAGSATVAFKLVANADEDLTTSATTMCETPAIAYTALTKGKVIVLPIPQGRMASTDLYFGVVYTIGGATTTYGTCSAFLAFDW